MSLGPFWRTPFTDVGASMLNHQTFSICAPFEMAVMDCMEAYGVYRGHKKCADLLDDYYECHTRDKILKRFQVMRAEREKQIAEGKLKGDEKYLKPQRPSVF